MNLDNKKVIELQLDDILPNRFQPRIKFSEDAINELSESIKEHGIIQPIVVRIINDKYEIIAGERRYKASILAGKKTIPAIVTDLNDKESAEIALIENVQREDLTPIEEAVSYKKILNMGYLTQDDLSNKLGKKQSTISNKLRLLNLDEAVQEALLEKKISERHARSLLRLDNNNQKIMLNKIITERLTVRKADDAIEKMLEVKTGNNGDIEILDLEDFPTKKGEIKMNNEANNNFNIPVSPIMDDEPTPNEFSPKAAPIIEEVIPIEVTDIFNIPEIQQTDETTQSINLPGFMDVDKIQNEAADINVEKPVADLNTLLEPTIVPEEPKPVAVDASIFGFIPSEPITSVVEEQSVTPGKFFDFDSLGNMEEETTPESIEVLLNNAAAETQKVEETQVPVAEVPADNKSQMFGINLEPKNPEFVTNIESQIVNTDFEEPKPFLDNNNLNFDQFYNNSEVSTTSPMVEVPNSFAGDIPTQSIVGETTPIMESTLIEPITFETPLSSINMSAMDEPKVLSSSSPTVGSLTNYDVPDSMESPTGTSQQPLISKPIYSVPSTDELDSFLNDLDSSTPLSQTVSESTTEPTAISVPVNNVTERMNQIVSIVREAKEKINALGINVDLDEFDFDDMYQAIIKVDK